jgi:hypothetical protein
MPVFRSSYEVGKAVKNKLSDIYIMKTRMLIDPDLDVYILEEEEGSRNCNLTVFLTAPLEMMIKSR